MLSVLQYKMLVRDQRPIESYTPLHISWNTCYISMYVYKCLCLHCISTLKILRIGMFKNTCYVSVSLKLPAIYRYAYIFLRYMHCMRLLYICTFYKNRLYIGMLTNTCFISVCLQIVYCSVLVYFNFQPEVNDAKWFNKMLDAYLI